MVSLDNLRQTIHQFLLKVEGNLTNNFTNQFSDLRFKLDSKLNAKELDIKMNEFLKENDFNLNLENYDFENNAKSLKAFIEKTFKELNI